MVPSRRRAQVLKATKLTEVSEIRDEEEKPQCNGRGEGGQGDNLEGSNDGKEVHKKCRGRWGPTSSVQFTDGQSGAIPSIQQSLYT